MNCDQIKNQGPFYLPKSKIFSIIDYKYEINIQSNLLWSLFSCILYQQITKTIKHFFSTINEKSKLQPERFNGKPEDTYHMELSVTSDAIRTACTRKLNIRCHAIRAIC